MSTAVAATETMTTQSGVQTRRSDLRARTYNQRLGTRLRAVRTEKGLSLRQVEDRSDGKFKTAVVGSYERGDRAITVVKLAELAGFYGVGTASLVSEDRPCWPDHTADLLLDLNRLAELPPEQGGPLARYAAVIRSGRSHHHGNELAMRTDDLRSLAVMYNLSVAALTEKLLHWEVLPPHTAGKGKPT